MSARSGGQYCDLHGFYFGPNTVWKACPRCYSPVGETPQEPFNIKVEDARKAIETGKPYPPRECEECRLAGGKCRQCARIGELADPPTATPEHPSHAWEGQSCMRCATVKGEFMARQSCPYASPSPSPLSLADVPRYNPLSELIASIRGTRHGFCDCNGPDDPDRGEHYESCPQVIFDKFTKRIPEGRMLAEADLEPLVQRLEKDRDEWRASAAGYGSRDETMSQEQGVLALIPARTGSRGIPGKNTRPLAGGPCITWLACDVAVRAGARRIYVSSDYGVPIPPVAEWIPRPSELAQDDTPMIAVVKHALEQIPGSQDQIVVLLQPTQPLRKPEHITAAIKLLQDTQADSVVSVVPIPPTDHALWQGHITDRGQILHQWTGPLSRRQALPPSYRRDGTVYAFFRRTVDLCDTIYGLDCRPLVIDPNDSCELDTEAQWADLERRWKERYGAVV